MDELVNIFIYSRSVWFLLNLFIAETLLLLSVFVNRIYHVNRLLGFFVLWISICFILPNNYFMLYKTKWLFPFMFIGYLYARKKKQYITRYKYDFVITGIVYGVGVSFFYRQYLFTSYSMFEYKTWIDVIYGILYYFISLIGVLFILQISIWLGTTKVKKYLSVVGRYTIDIYVLHMFLIKFVPMFFADDMKPNVIWSYSYLLVSSFLIVIICFISDKLLRHTHVYRLMIGKYTIKVKK